MTAQAEGCQVVGRNLRPAQGLPACLPFESRIWGTEKNLGEHKCARQGFGDPTSAPLGIPDVIKNFTSFYNNKGLKLYTISYKYSEFGNITSIEKNINDREICLAFKYDLLNRITERTIYLDNNKISTQSYSYDVLNRIITYKDDNQEIYVKKYEDDMLISYSITDKMGNETVVTNNFIQEIYLNTTLVSNGQTNTIKDVSYVDNVMLKKPKASEDDLDLILSKLLAKSDNAINTINMNLSVNRKSIDLIDENIKIKTLPISIRKRVLYNIAKQSKS